MAQLFGDNEHPRNTTCSSPRTVIRLSTPRRIIAKAISPSLIGLNRINGFSGTQLLSGLPIARLHELTVNCLDSALAFGETLKRNTYTCRGRPTNDFDFGGFC